jgi:hypothetical protein
MFISMDIGLSYVTRFGLWQLDVTKFQVWNVKKIINNVNLKTDTMCLITSSGVFFPRGRNFININKFNFYNKTVLKIGQNSTPSEMCFWNPSFWKPVGSQLEVGSSGIQVSGNQLEVGWKSVWSHTSSVPFKIVISADLGLNIRRQGDNCETSQNVLISMFLQSGCRQAVSHMFMYKGKAVYTRPTRKPYFSREFLEVAAEILQEDEHAPATKSAFNSKVKTFFTFASEIGLTDLPLDGHEMVIFATWLTLSGHCGTAGSLRQYLSAMKVLC